MEYRYQYQSDEERDSLLAEHSDRFLVRVENITEGNFLVFSDKAPIPSIEHQVNDLKQKMEESNLVQLEVLASIFEELTMLGSA